MQGFFFLFETEKSDIIRYSEQSKISVKLETIFQIFATIVMLRQCQ